MSSIELEFESGEASLGARSFELHEAMSSCFRATVTAVSRDDDLDLDALVGRPATLTLVGPGQGGRRTLACVCLAAEQGRAEHDGLSTYTLTFGPKLALLAYRSRHRVFQHRTALEIARAVLAEWGLVVELAVDVARHAVLPYRVQLGETDLAFLMRILEEAGIAFTFPTEGANVDVLLLDASRQDEPLVAAHVERPAPGLTAPFATHVRVGRKLRVGRVVLRDTHFRLGGGAALVGDVAIRGEERLRHEHYVPGASVADITDPPDHDTPVADAGGAERPDPSTLERAAELALQRERVRRREVSFESNLDVLRPGLRVTLTGHPRRELADATLLVVEQRTTGSVVERAWRIESTAVHTDVPFRPARATSKPHAHGVHSATVVGPAGERVHTDEHGRVRVRFAWDPSESPDEASSCWLRVARPWAGAGHASFMLPRVGDEVLVGFFGGDPDQPVIVGALNDATAPVPYKLPENKTVSTWRSASVPETGGFNELRFEDRAGSELVAIQAERDLHTLVKRDASLSVGASRLARVGTTDEALVGERHALVVGEGPNAARIEATPGRIVLTTGEARIVLDGPNITFEAPGHFLVKAAGLVRVESSEGEVVVQGGPIVRINPRGAGEHPDGPGGAIPMDLPDGAGDAELDDEMVEVAQRSWFDAARPKYLDEATAPGGALDPTPRGDATDALRAFKFAVAGRCVGLPEGVLLRRAGALNRSVHGSTAGDGDPGNGLFGGQAPYGNGPGTLEAMKQGFAYFDRQYGEPG